MKVLMISGDRHVLEAGSPAAKRLELQRAHVERLDVFVWPQVHSVREIWKAARANTYDVVTTQDPFWRGLLAWRIARSFGAKLNVQVHADLSDLSLPRHAMAQVVLRHADTVRVVSEKLKEQVWRMGVRVPIRVLPMFIDVAPFARLARLAHEQPTVLWIGRFEKEKNPFAAIEIVRLVRKAGIHARLVMLGEGSLKLALGEVARDVPVGFPGWKDPASYLQTADVVVSTSKTESFGASIIESLAAGVPVVAPDIGIAKEAGAIVVPREDLAEAVIEVLKHPPAAELKLSLPSAEEWAGKWKETLI